MKLGTLALAALPLVAADADGKRWWAHVLYLADDKLEGRNTGSEGHRVAVGYVASEFERAGLEPRGTAGYRQPMRFRTRRIIEERSSVELLRGGRAEPVSLGEDATLNARIDAAPEIEADAVFAGYGLRVPELGYDDFSGLNLRGRIAVVLSGGPSTIAGPVRAHAQSAAVRWQHLKRAGAIGLATIQNPKAMDVPWSRSSLARFQPQMSLADPVLDETAGQNFALTINPDRAERFFASSGRTFAEMVEIAGVGKPLPRFPLNLRIRARVDVERGELESDNVSGLLRGADPKLAGEYVVLTAHLDHVGRGRAIDGDEIYNGAMDNAAGIASLIEIARAFRESGRRPRRSMLFLAVTGEEKGLQGSRFFAAYPTVSAPAIVANINLDMFLPLHALRILTAMGLDESDLGDRLREVGRETGVVIQADPQPERNLFIRSDQYSFIKRGVPALAFKFGFEKGSPEEQLHGEWLKKRYHAPSDDVQQPVDIGGAARFNDLILRLTEKVANADSRPQWKPESFFRRFSRR